MKLYLVRHALADYATGISPWELPGLPLSTKGEQQALSIAQTLRHESIDRIFCSDALRAQKTLEPYLQYANVAPVYDFRLREHGMPSVNGGVITQKDFLSFKNELMQEYSPSLVVAHGDTLFYLAEFLGSDIGIPKWGSLHTLDV